MKAIGIGEPRHRSIQSSNGDAVLTPVSVHNSGDIVNGHGLGFYSVKTPVIPEFRDPLSTFMVPTLP